MTRCQGCCLQSTVPAPIAAEKLEICLETISEHLEDIGLVLLKPPWNPQDERAWNKNLKLWHFTIVGSHWLLRLRVYDLLRQLNRYDTMR